jgi:nicotinate phosphoribosyltransferase
MDDIIPPPVNGLVSPLLTDLYQITMAYAYWKTGRHMDHAVFELFFRKNPFGGEYTVFAGLDEVLKFLVNFRFTKSDLDYLKSTPSLSHCDPLFFDDYLANLDCSKITVQSMKQGTVAFPRIPLLIISGPLGITQLLETTLLTLINYPSLLTTNAVRMVVAATSASGNTHHLAPNKTPKCIEFGLRRAQGPDGGFSASKYAILGGFVATSNVLAGKLLNVPISGTHAHAFVQSHSSLDQVTHLKILQKDGGEVALLPIVLKYRDELGSEWRRTNDGELAAFIAYAVAFPESFLCLIDTYDTINSGLRNFILVSLALHECGYNAKGIRLDSGDLSYLSIECEKMFQEIATRFHCPFFCDLDIVASNDINEDVLHSLNKQGHAVTIFGIGTNLVTCQKQPALVRPCDLMYIST